MDDNIKNLRDALEWLYKRIQDEAELDSEMTNDHAIQLGFILSMLNKFQPKNCDVGTAYEQANRMRQYCATQKRGGIRDCAYCPIAKPYQRDCALTWAQMPYAEEGGAK